MLELLQAMSFLIMFLDRPCNLAMALASSVLRGDLSLECCFYLVGMLQRVCSSLFSEGGSRGAGMAKTNHSDDA